MTGDIEDPKKTGYFSKNQDPMPNDKSKVTYTTRWNGDQATSKIGRLSDGKA